MGAKSSQVDGLRRAEIAGQMRGNPVLYITSAASVWNANYPANGRFDDKLGNSPVKFCYRPKWTVCLPLLRWFV